MGIGLLQAGSLATDPGPQPLKKACLNARQLVALTATWPELEMGRLTGIYQAAGQEKGLVTQELDQLFTTHGGLHLLSPVAMIGEYLPYGPFARLAMARQCLGPFATHCGDELSAAQALTAALADLAAGRCEQAFVGGYRRQPGAVWLMLLGHQEAPPLRWQARYTFGSQEPQPADLGALAADLGRSVTLLPPAASDDILGLDRLAMALRRAQAGEAVAVWQVTADGRGLLVGLAGGA
jgi:hypothetical protein